MSLFIPYSDVVSEAYEDQCESEDCIRLRYTDGNGFAVCSSNWDLSLNDQICKYLYKG